MKTKSVLCALAFAASAALSSAAPLNATAAIHLQPEDNSPVVSYLKAGTDPVRAGPAPDGWLAVEIMGEHEGYVMNKDITKGLDVVEGTAVHLAPEPSSPTLATIEKGDQTEITGLHGKWTQIRVAKKLTGYVRVGGVPSAPVAATAPDTGPVAPMAPSPVTPMAYGEASGGQPAPVMTLNNQGPATLPRFFQGRFESTRRPFMPRRPYDWQLKDDAGARYAYLDLSKLLLTEQPETYVDRVVVAYGTAKPAPGGRDIVIEVESLQLK